MDLASGHVAALNMLQKSHQNYKASVGGALIKLYIMYKKTQELKCKLLIPTL
jgi:hypothetical protein